MSLSGAHQWTTRIASSTSDEVYGLAIDSETDNVYASGYHTGSALSVMNGGISTNIPSLGAGRTGYIVKLGSDGSFSNLVTQFAGGNSANITGLTLDNNGILYANAAVSNTASVDFGNSSFNRSFSMRINTSNYSDAFGFDAVAGGIVAATPSNLYTAGSFSGTRIFDPSNPSTGTSMTSVGAYDIYFTRLNTCGYYTTVSPNALSNISKSVSYSQQLSVDNAPSAVFTLTSGALPDGLTLSSSGLISGTPTTAGAYSFTISASVGTCVLTKDYTLVVDCNNPSNIIAILGARAIKLTWDAGSYTAIQVQWKAASTSVWYGANPASTATEYRITGLTPSTTYDLRVRNHCVAGDANTTWQTLSATTLETPTCSPLSPATAIAGASAARFSWPGYTSGTYKFELRYRVQGSSTWTVITTGAVVTNYTVYGLSASTTYEWQIRNACNPVGEDWNAWSSISTFTTLSGPSCVSLDATATTSVNTVKFSWPSYPTGMSKFELRYRIQGSSTWSAIMTGAVVTNYTLYGLSASTTYEWQIRNACNPVGEDWNEWSTLSTFTTLPAGGRLGEESFNVSVYPVPSTGMVNVEIADLEESAAYEVYNVYGQKVAAGTLAASSNVLDLSSQATGVYTLKVATAKGSATKQIVLSK
ncbi:fibronectin type III domain-containing protein [Flexibacter flexilis]|uniref:fibronectin type III domain-containing protein n=1 Tax=Flexibacter flexilis TaxID=998 RepID=UPI0015A72369|nr:T9SS type A sorting domain-containing protein [Flexibacter flexilis]